MNIPEGITLGDMNRRFADRFYVEFDLYPMEKWSEAEGRKVLVDKERAIITLPGGKDVHRKIITPELLEEWRNGKWRNGEMIRGPAPWAIQKYENWKKGNEAPEYGTALKNWPPVTPAFLQTCLAANVRTVEDLAGLNDDGLKRLGIGALNWKRQAREWLHAANNPAMKDAGRVAALETRVEALETTIREQHQTIRALEEQNKQLRNGQGPALPVEPVPVQSAHEFQHSLGPVPEEPKVIFKAQTDERDALIARGAELGIKLDRRMKAETMRKRIGEVCGK